MEDNRMLRRRRKIIFNLVMSLILLIAILAFRPPVSLASFVSSATLTLLGFAVCIYAGLLIFSPRFMQAHTQSPAQMPVPRLVSDLYGPDFPVGRCDDMVDYTDTSSRPFKERSISLPIQVRGPHGIEHLAQKIYFSMSEAGENFKYCVDTFRSSEALVEAENFLILKDIQSALGKIYEEETGKPATDLLFFRLPEENIRHQVAHA